MHHLTRLSCVLLAGLLGTAPAVPAQAGKAEKPPNAKADDQGRKKEAKEGEFPREWFWHTKEEQWTKHAELIGKPMPKLTLDHWANGKVDLQKGLKGKVVVIDFWATWCGPCIKAIPHNNEMFEKHGKDGLVFIGVCGSNRGQDKMGDVITDKGIKYPVARDSSQDSAKEWRVMWWPTYGVVDRKGRLRAIGLKPDHVDAVVEKLLKEPAEGAAAAPTGSADKDKGEETGKEPPAKGGDKAPAPPGK